MRRAKGFTIVELLVVVAIVALLIAMLLPSLGMARAQAQRTVCANRLRQLAAACITYANENRGLLPPGRRDFDDKGEHCIWISHGVYDYFLRYVGAPVPINPPGQNGIGDAAVVCPNLYASDSNPLPVDVPSRIGWVIGYNYLGGHRLISTNNNWPVASPVRLGDGGSLPLFADLNDWSAVEKWTIVPHQRRAGGGFFYGARGGVVPTELGAAGGNVAFLDGSVRWKALGEPTDDGRYGEMTAHCTVAYPTLSGLTSVDMGLW